MTGSLGDCQSSRRKQPARQYVLSEARRNRTSGLSCSVGSEPIGCRKMHGPGVRPLKELYYER